MALWSDVARPRYVRTIELAGKENRILITEKNNEIVGKKPIAVHGTHEYSAKIEKGNIKKVLATLALAASLAAGTIGMATSHLQEQNPSNDQPQVAITQTSDELNNQDEMIAIKKVDGNYIKVSKDDYERANAEYLEKNPEPNIPYSAPDNNISPMENDIYPNVVTKGL